VVPNLGSLNLGGSQPTRPTALGSSNPNTATVYETVTVQTRAVNYVTIQKPGTSTITKTLSVFASVASKTFETFYVTVTPTPGRGLHSACTKTIKCSDGLRCKPVTKGSSRGYCVKVNGKYGRCGSLKFDPYCAKGLVCVNNVCR
jgi:hypothetical protein